ncbi:uncharacterized protein DS421_6g192580 [Arachis hypogaea]|nr:uncharacterized protein DS421_6g192580 [Arachis hypogaea]
MPSCLLCHSKYCHFLFPLLLFTCVLHLPSLPLCDLQSLVLALELGYICISSSDIMNLRSGSSYL